MRSKHLPILTLIIMGILLASLVFFYEESHHTNITGFAATSATNTNVLVRTNPLQAFIETNFVGTGGGNFPHIKLYGLAFGDWPPEDQEWIGTHYDIYNHGGWNLPQYAKPVNPTIIVLSDRNSIGFNYGGDIDFWLTQNDNRNRDWLIENNYTFDDLILNYALDTAWTVPPFKSYKGWNPADDDGRCGGVANDGINDEIMNLNGGCSGLPSDPERTATYINESRVDAQLPGWFYSDLAGEAWYLHSEFQLNNSLFIGTAYERDGLRIDSVSEGYVPPESAASGLQLNRTLEYFGEPWNQSFPWIEDGYATVSHLTPELEAIAGKTLYVFGNVGSTYYPCVARTEMIQHHLENIHDETWMNYHVPTFFTYEGNYNRSIVCPLTQFMRQGYAYAFDSKDETLSDEGKRFTLATFYLINHEMAYYFYRAKYTNIGGPLPDWQWNPYVEYNIGQPIANNYGFLDFEDNSGTNEHFEFATGEDPLAPGVNYHILGREYEYALVLSKIMGLGGTQNASPTTHQLPGTFRVLNADLTLGPEITEISLKNNEGVILIKAATIATWDLNFDGSIDLEDVWVAVQSFMLGLGDDGYNPDADFNGDDLINVLDLAYIAINYDG